MPRYKITDPQTGTVFHLTGDSPPTEAEATEAFQGAALDKSLKRRGFTQEPPQEEFLSRFKNIGSLLGGMANTPQGMAMTAAVMPGAPVVARGVLVGGGKLIQGAARGAEYLPLPNALAPTKSLKLWQSLGSKVANLGRPILRGPAEVPTRMAAKTLAKARQLVKSPEAIAAEQQLQRIAETEASREGMRHAAWGRAGQP